MDEGQEDGDDVRVDEPGVVGPEVGERIEEGAEDHHLSKGAGERTHIF